MEEKEIWREAIEFGINQLNKIGWDNDSTNYYIVSDGLGYPPKEVLKNATEFISKNYSDFEYKKIYGGDQSTNKIIRDAGFEIRPFDEIKYIEHLAYRVRNQLLKDEHPLAEHIWKKKHSPTWWWISFSKSGEDPKTSHLHYEFILRANQITVELHPEGDDIFKALYSSLISSFLNKHTGYKSAKWSEGYQIKDNSHLKLVLTKSANYNKSDDIPSSSIVKELSELLKKMYDEFYLSYYQKLTSKERWLIMEYQKFKNKIEFKNRKTQSVIVPIFQSILHDFLDNNTLNSGDFTALIQIFRNSAKHQTIHNYLENLFEDENQVNKYLTLIQNSNSTGYTGGGKSAIHNLEQNQLLEIKNFLQNIKNSNIIEEISKNCENFNALDIPQFKSGIYSAFLYYLKPNLCPIVNGQHKEFLKWMDFGNDYPDLILKFNRLLEILNEDDFGQLDAFIYFTNIPPKNNSTIIDTSNNPQNEVKMDINKNLILYGPPGTGKTYHTIDKAVKIASPSKYLENDHKANKKVFDNLITSGQIVFTTFHQSMTYEDFVEGIKPEIGDSANLKYKIEDGVFIRFCKIDFEPYYLMFLNYLKALYDYNPNDQKLIIREYFISNINIENGQYGYIQPDESPINISKEDVKNIFNKFGIKEVTTEQLLEAITRLKDQSNASRLRDLYNVFIRYIKQLNRVLIIDEINRGNVSQIFGELITLLENDKREGEEETISATLPYSKEQFSVPRNLYIIGTMNTADRSVEAIDTALRRRFSFEEMMPQYELIETELGEKNRYGDYECSKILETINDRIEVLLDRDHLIGHSYFLDLKRVEDFELGLSNIFKNKVIPLLQEYFYNDYSKIQAVLGEGFVTKKEKQNPFTPIKGSDLDIQDYLQKPRFQFETDKKGFKLIDALQILIDGKKEDVS